MATPQKIAALCVLGGDLAGQGESLGPRSIGNCKAAAKETPAIIRSGLNPILLLSPGYAGRDGLIDKYPQQRGSSMATMMKSHLMMLGVGSKHICIADEVWGTRAEIHVFREFIRNLEKCGYIVERKILVMPWWHALRGRRIAVRAGLADIEVFETDDSPSLWQMLLEARNIVGEELRSRFPAFGRFLKTVRGRD